MPLTGDRTYVPSERSGRPTLAIIGAINSPDIARGTCNGAARFWRRTGGLYAWTVRSGGPRPSGTRGTRPVELVGSCANVNDIFLRFAWTRYWRTTRDRL